MNKYTVRFYKGDYKQRQESANKDRAICYVEHHFNASESKKADYSMVIVSSNASEESKKWGEWYANAIDEEFKEVNSTGGSNGIRVGGKGDGNLRHTKMPAILLEPLFLSNLDELEIIESQEGRTKLAQVLVDSIIKFFPAGGLVGKN